MAIAALPGASAQPRISHSQSGSRYEPDGLLDVYLNHNNIVIVVEAKSELEVVGADIHSQCELT